MKYQRVDSPWTYSMVQQLRTMLHLTPMEVHRTTFPQIAVEKISARMSYERKLNLQRLGLRPKPRNKSDRLFDSEGALASLSRDYVAKHSRAAHEEPPSNYVPTHEQRARFDPHAHREARHYKGTFEL